MKKKNKKLSYLIHFTHNLHKVFWVGAGFSDIIVYQTFFMRQNLWRRKTKETKTKKKQKN